jgi:outer membrane protein OmpA-like peptidoglycan-associated protein
VARYKRLGRDKKDFESCKTMKTLSVNIPQKCHENIDKMRMEDKGRWCLSCQKHVVDFTSKSNEEIIRYFQNSTEQEVCGTFYDRQLNIPLNTPTAPSKEKKLFSFRFYSFILSLFLSNWFISCRVDRRTSGAIPKQTDGDLGKSISINEHLASIEKTCEPTKDIRTNGPVVIHDYYKFLKGKKDTTKLIIGSDQILPSAEEKEEKMVLQFMLGKFSISESDKKGLDKMSSLLLKNPDAELYIAGYADSTGSERINKKISKKRAEAVKQYFLDKKLNNTIHVTWFGERDFVAENETENGRAKNRRVEVIVKE